MQVEFELRPGDLMAFGHYHFSRASHLRRRWVTPVVLGVIVVMILPVYVVIASGKPLSEALRDTWPLFLAPVMFLTAFPFLYRWHGRRMQARLLAQAKARGIFGPCRVSLDEQGLTDEKPIGTSRRVWRSVTKIAVTPQHLFIYTSPSEAFLVPARAFSKPAEFERFIDEVSRRSGEGQTDHNDRCQDRPAGSSPARHKQAQQWADDQQKVPRAEGDQPQAPTDLTDG